MINEVYRQYNFHQYPFVLMTLKMKTDAYDVNVTPDKRTIFVHEEKQIIEALKVRFFPLAARANYKKNKKQKQNE